jgi:hypothetical protein
LERLYIATHLGTFTSAAVQDPGADMRRSFVNQLGLLLLLGAAAWAADSNPPPILTVELRDGSRLIGTCPVAGIKFQSALLGDFTLTPGSIRSVQSSSTNAATLTTAKGDTLSVALAEPVLPLTTSFGEVKLAVNSLRGLTVSAPSPLGIKRPGLVALWSGEGDGRDSAGGNFGELADVAFARGKVGQAFSFNGTTSSIRVPACRALDLGKEEGFTLMAWIKPTTVEGLHPLLQWSGDAPLNFWIGVRPFEDGVLRGIITDQMGNHVLCSQPDTLTPGVFQHIAFTYDKASGMGVLCLNGVVVGRRQLGRNLTAKTQGDLLVSRREDQPGHWSTGRMFEGLMDEIALYNRALSPEEIAGICADENEGQPLAKPTPSSGWFESWMR